MTRKETRKRKGKEDNIKGRGKKTSQADCRFF